jgi:hypothetical protein
MAAALSAAGRARAARPESSPKTSPQQKVTAEYEQWILELRTTRNLGVRRIQNELKRFYHLSLGLEIIQKVLHKHHVPALQRPTRQR